MIINGGAGGTGSDECTARLADIPKGLKAVAADSNDEAGVGTMALTGNAQAGHVLAGETFYTNNYKTKLTGTMTVNSLLSFSVAAYSGRRVLAKWQNPNQAAGKPFSGVIIRYSTSGYPGTTGGTQIYKGAGNNTAAGAWSQAYLDMPSLNTTYYFSCYPYVTIGEGEINGVVRNVTCKTSGELNKTFTASGSYTIPAGYTKMDLFAVGGGGGGCSSYSQSSGGGGGYTSTTLGYSVVGGTTLTIIVGSGGAGAAYNRTDSFGTDGGSSSISGIVSAAGGRGGGSKTGGSADMRSGAYCNGGSGGGETNQNSGSGADMPAYKGGNGGSDGGNGQVSYNWQSYQGCRGQGRTTRAYGSKTGTLYSGGGGTGDSSSGGYGNNSQGMGGAGGGGNGGLINTYTDKQKSATAGSTNTGGGGGGSTKGGQPGGSGIVLMKLY